MPAQSPGFNNSKLPLADSLSGSSGLGLDKGAIEDPLGGVCLVCNGVIRCTFYEIHGRRACAAGLRSGVVAPAGDLEGNSSLGHRPAVRDGGNRAHAPNIGDESDDEIVGKRQEIA